MGNVPVQQAPDSFRDPDARVFIGKDTVYRLLTPEGQAIHEAVRESSLLVALDGKVIPCQLVDDTIHSPRLPFISYPYEWSFSMLEDAALLHLDIMEEALARGFILKDATPYNVQFIDCKPLFIDVTSFAPYEDGMPWQAYTQFCRMFLNPLLLHAATGLPLQPWVHGSGLSPRATARALPLLFTLRHLPGVMGHVMGQAALEALFSSAPNPRIQIPKKTLNRQLRGLRGFISRLKARHVNVDYTADHYTMAARDAKADFVHRVLARTRPKVVWDLGCNLGAYSKMAATYANLVVAMDVDSAIVDALYRSRPHNILPLVMDLFYPSPDMGWAQSEHMGLEQRGPCDLALALALIHHLRITGGIPLSHIVAWLSWISKAAVIEWVPKEDTRAQQLLAWREDVFDDYTEETLQAALVGGFGEHDAKPLPDSKRVMYYAWHHD